MLNAERKTRPYSDILFNMRMSWEEWDDKGKKEAAKRV